MKKIAILYQSKLPPIKNGIPKPMKLGGYSDSGADIAFELQNNGIEIVTPTPFPDSTIDLDWVFPDSIIGIQEALDKGANTFWLNTVLYKNHDIENFFGLDIQFIGQIPSQVDIYDDKYFTNELLRKNHIPVPKSQLITVENWASDDLEIDFPMILKPIRGRGSQGVLLLNDRIDFENKLKEIFSSQDYGNAAYVERFLSGQEITITVMPSGTYLIDDEEKMYKKPWCLPAVKRFNHDNGVVPYNGIVAVMNNSAVLGDLELHSDRVNEVYSHCEKAAQLLNIKAPIRIDCRADESGYYYLFDVNLKPNMTGPSRSHRKNQDSLSLLAARKIGWNYFNLLSNMINQEWNIDK